MLGAYRWNPSALPWVVVGLALFALAGVIYSRQRASRVAVLFCAMIVLVGLWFMGFTGMLSATRAEVADVWARLALAAVAFLPAAIYDFTATALRLPSNRAIYVRIAWILSLAFSLIALFTHGLIGGVHPHPWGWYPFVGPVAPLFLLLFLAALIAQVIEGVAEYRRTTDRKRRRRVANLMISFVIVYAAAIDFIPMFGVDMQPVGYIPVLAFIVIAWGTIRRHRFQPITAARAAREILETMADALFVLDADGRIRVINGAVTSLLGYTDSDLLGRSIDALEPITGDATISRTLAELARRGAIRDQERVFRDRDGETVHVSVSISAVSEEDVQRGAVVIARDIRERKRAEAELRSAMKRLELSNRELEDFAYVASHDLQEPLRKIQAFGDLLESKHAAALAPQARDYIDRMRSAAKRMQVLINDLLTFSRVTTKAQPFVPVDLEQIARDVTKDLETRIHDTGGHIEIGALPTIDADPLQMRQLLQNLAGNALKFHRPDVPPLVRMDGHVENGTCTLSVADNGIGFDEKYAERIFTMFERLHGRGTYEGTGIGLAICRRIAERHGGNVVARSTPGEGSTFIVTLPVSHVGETNGSPRKTDRHPARG
ncbi:MAG TPA: ATP-binding protein [Thermoanaerobaculia bacterium]|nr:ATP-binding protein [Thermoanaerobaculia bacterium]